jgi:F-type H+-transporting ATPase subunit b
LPQLDIATYATQIVWLAITFIALYWAMTRIGLPSVTRVLDERQARLKSDIDTAERLKAEAESILAAYGKAIAEARGAALATLKTAAAEQAARTAKRDGAFAAKLAERTAEAERRIGAAKNAALAEIRGVAALSAGAIAAKLAGLEIGHDRTAAAVAAVLATDRR